MWGDWGSCSVTCILFTLVDFGDWRQWGDWGSCSVTCILFTLVDFGDWQQWGDWGSCSVTCGGGTRRRFRLCETGQQCEGEDNDTGDCNTQACPQSGQCTIS